MVVVMADPSEYELAAWNSIQKSNEHPLARVLSKVSQRVSTGAGDLSRNSKEFLAKHPRVQSVVKNGQEKTAKGGEFVSSKARTFADSIPDWGDAAWYSIRRTTSRVSRIGLSPNQVVAKHQKQGHPVVKLSDLHRLDLEQVDAVHGKAINWYYSAIAAVSGSGAGFAISGGQLTTVVSAGAAAAPGGAVVAGAFLGDAAAVLGLASRAVGHISLLYGYDPEEPVEKLFVMSVVNAGTAGSAAAKSAAMRDVSRLTQALIRGKSWKVLNDSVISQVARQFGKEFSIRLTKQGLGKVVPAVGIVLGGTFNWTALESVVDSADTAYRRRFLLDKYPQLDKVDDVPVDVSPSATDDSDEEISVFSTLEEAGIVDFETEVVDGE